MASHITDCLYFDIAKKNKKNKNIVFEKIERDTRDLSFFPEEKKRLSRLAEAWKKILNIYYEE